MKKLISVLLVLLFAVSSLPIKATATESPDTVSYYSVSDDGIAVWGGSNRLECEINEDGSTVYIVGCWLEGEVIIPETVQYYESGTEVEYTVTGISDGAYFSPEITKLTLPDTIEYIGSDAFYGCSKMTEITLPENLNYIGPAAFGACTSLTSIILPPLSSLPAHLFSRCSSLTSVVLPEGLLSIEEGVFIGCVSLSSITLPESLMNIGDNAFSGTALTTITIPKNVESIGSFSLGGKYLSQINVHSENTAFTDIDGVLFNKDITKLICYPNGKNAEAYTVPETVASIGEYAFASSTLSTITLPSSLTEICAHAFVSCQSLVSLPLPEGLISIGEEAFNACYELSNIVLPESLVSIGFWAFVNCNINEFNIPANTTDIAYGAFHSSNLDKINVDPNNPKYCSENGILFSKDKSILHTFPENLLENLDPESLFKIAEVYQNSEGNYLWKYTIPDSVKTIGAYSFSNNWRINHIVIPDSVTEISDSAFRGCRSLKIAEIGKNVVSIGSEAFENCSYLYDITLPDGLTFLGKSSFAFCDALTDIYVPDGISIIPYYAFSECDALTTVSLPGGLTKIDDGAFNNCESLTSVYFRGDAPLTIHMNAFSRSVIDQITMYFPENSSGWTTPVWRVNSEDYNTAVYVIGDFSGNGVLDTSDIAAAARHFAGDSIARIETLIGDVNGDGVFSRADVMYLARALAGWTGYSLP